MTRAGLLVMACVGVGVTMTAQGRDAVAVLADARQALGGEARIAAVKTLTAVGTSREARPGGTVDDHDVELSIVLPDRFRRRSVLMAMGPTSVYRNAGFNGDRLIDLVDTPPALMSGGDGNRVIRIDVGGRWEQADDAGPEAAARATEAAAARRERLLSDAKADFARLTLGFFASSFSGMPLQFAYAGVAESPDGRAEVLDVTGAHGFAARLFVDAETHLPLMLTWMAKEPLEVRVEDRGEGETVQILRGDGSGDAPARAGAPGPADVAARLREAESNRRTVEWRLYYGAFTNVDGLRLPTRLNSTIDGRPGSELVIDRFRINPKIDPRTFEPTRD